MGKARLDGSITDCPSGSEWSQGRNANDRITKAFDRRDSRFVQIGMIKLAHRDIALKQNLWWHVGPLDNPKDRRWCYIGVVTTRHDIYNFRRATSGFSSDAPSATAILSGVIVLSRKTVKIEGRHYGKVLELLIGQARDTGTIYWAILNREK